MIEVEKNINKMKKKKKKLKEPLSLRSDSETIEEATQLATWLKWATSSKTFGDSISFIFFFFLFKFRKEENWRIIIKKQKKKEFTCVGSCPSNIKQFRYFNFLKYCKMAFCKLFGNFFIIQSQHIVRIFVTQSLPTFVNFSTHLICQKKKYEIFKNSTIKEKRRNCTMTEMAFLTPGIISAYPSFFIFCSIKLSISSKIPSISSKINK